MNDHAFSCVGGYTPILKPFDSENKGATPGITSFLG